MTTGFSSVDYNNTDRLLQTLAGIGLVSAGAGLTIGAWKNLRKRFLEATTPDLIQPSKLVRNRTSDKKLSLTSDYINPRDTEKEAQYLGNIYKGYIQKEAWSIIPRGWLLKKVTGINFDDKTLDQLGSKAGREELASELASLPGKTTESWIRGTKPITQAKIDADKAKGINYYTLDSVTNNPKATLYQKFTANLATSPKLQPLWFLPAAAALGLTGYGVGKWIANAGDKAMGKNKNYMRYSDDAQKIYDESAKYLRDVMNGKVSEEEAQKLLEEEEKKRKKLLKKSAALVAGDGTSSFFWNPWILAGIPAALWTAHQIRGFNAGINDAKEELADRTHMIRAWQAAAKKRQYDYNDLAADLLPEPIRDSRAKKIKRKEKKLLNSVMDDDNNNQLRYENYIFNEMRNDSDKLNNH